MNINKIEYNSDKVNNLVSKYIKEHKGQTKDSVAAQMGVSKSTLYGTNPTAENLAKICSFLGIEPNDLFLPLKNELKSKQTNVAASPITLYSPPDEKEELKQIMLEQQIEIAGLLKEKIGWMEKAHSLEMELERVKKMSAPEKDALAG